MEDAQKPGVIYFMAVNLAWPKGISSFKNYRTTIFLMVFWRIEK